MSQTTTKADPSTIAIGDLMTYLIHTDRNVYEVVAVEGGGKKLTLRACRMTLLNGADSGEPDALKVFPGGFAAHTTGVQRWSVEPDPDGHEVVVTYRPAVGRWKVLGNPTRGRGCHFTPGSRPFRDFNY
jgi:hypothetical protein